jgi:hypothetical protein
LKNLVSFSLIAVSLFFLVLPGVALSVTQADIRVAYPSTLGNVDQIDYVASISDCPDLAAIRAGETGRFTDYDSDSVSYDPALPGRCFLSFAVSGVNRFSPVVEIVTTDASVEVFSEHFVSESNPPALTFTSVSIAPDGSGQRLVVEVEATDDQDLAYLSFNIVGLRASTLRANGGVIAEARQDAFAETETAQRVYPEDDSQTVFSFSLPLISPLSAEEIAFDAIVMADIVAMDASGNHTTLSKIAFTGDSIQENVLGLVVSDTTLVINNPLQTPVIVPAIEFQFRGLVQLPGSGNGISYQSSHPELIGVTAGGLVYALGETGDETVTITVEYPGLPPATIPVVADFSKNLIGLAVAGVDADNPLVLPSLNTFHALPELQGIFDDGSYTVISGHWQPVITIDPLATSYISMDHLHRVRADVAIPVEAPAELTVHLQELPEVSVRIPVAAIDAAPEIELTVPSQVKSQTDLILVAQATDDVGIKNVQFLLDGVGIGTVLKAPFELTLPISEELEGRTLVFSAVATDSKGESTLSADYPVVVTAPPKPVIPTYEFVKPATGIRVVETSPVTLSIETSLGPIEAMKSSSGISTVVFSFDGDRVGEASYPFFETRGSVDEHGRGYQEVFEIWSTTVNVPEISTDETSIAVGARVHTRSGGEDEAPAKLLRIIENMAPQVSLLAPETGSIVTAGQQLAISVEAMDDTLALGTHLELLRNGEVIEEEHYTDQDADIDSLTMQSQIFQFSYLASVEEIGETLKFQARVRDFHNQLNQSTIVRVPVKKDQPPTVAIEHPVEGASFVSGLPLQIRANAVDDIGVKQVDFFINDQLVGSDTRAPYAYAYETPVGIEVEQRLRIHAVVTDTSDQTAISNSVDVTLGHDEEPPVVNISSPPLSATAAGDDIAGIIEQSEFVFKVTGYDNVKATHSEVRGFARDGNSLVLTGNPDDILAGEEFPIEQIPGVMRAYSSLLLVEAPAYEDLTATDYDPYPVTVTVYDEIGNSSTASIVIGVYEDQPPEVVNLLTDTASYRLNDSAEIDILARDDRAVVGLEIFYLIDGEPVYSHLKNIDNGLIPLAILQFKDDFDIADLDLSNEDHRLTVQATAYDILGQSSELAEVEAHINADHSAPKAALIDPAPGKTLYSGERYHFTYRATDETGLRDLLVQANGSQIYQTELSGKEGQGTFSYTIADSADTTLTFTLIATDAFGNESTLSQYYTVAHDQPPLISIRHPAAGSRLIEGERFTINAQVQDNRQITFVEFYIERDGESLFSKTYTGREIEDIVDAGKYFSAKMRVPTRVETGDLAVGVRARDNGGLTTDVELDLIIIDDSEPPLISFSEPADDIERYPGETVKIKGIGSDNIYIDTLTPYLIQGDEEIELEWKMLTRNDRIEQIRVPNSDSFGTAIAAERFYVDYEGMIMVPPGFIERAGESFELVVRATDMGVNETTSPSITLLIKHDEEPPTITITLPRETIVHREPLEASVTIRDNQLIAAYDIDLVSEAVYDIAAATEVNEQQVTLSAVPEELLQTFTSPEISRNYTIVVTAVDRSGNEAQATKQFTMVPDQPPTIAFDSVEPENETIRGSLIYPLLRVEDDFVKDQNSNTAAWLYTSLNGLADPQGGNLQVTVPAEDAPPRFSFGYPESEGISATLRINDKYHLIFADGNATLIPTESASIESVRLTVEGYQVDYEVDVFTSVMCTPLHQHYELSAEDLAAAGGTVTLADYPPAGPARTIITPRIRGMADGAAPLHRIIISQAELPGSGPIIQLFIRDDQGQDGVALLSTEPLRSVRNKQQEFTDTFPLVSDPRIQSITMFGGATDYLSFGRGAGAGHGTCSVESLEHR